MALHTFDVIDDIRQALALTAVAVAVVAQQIDEEAVVITKDSVTAPAPIASITEGSTVESTEESTVESTSSSSEDVGEIGGEPVVITNSTPVPKPSGNASASELDTLADEESESAPASKSGSKNSSHSAHDSSSSGAAKVVASAAAVKVY
ncbi:hypothetical protein BX661DRAFT_170069 [Kickxella alabastrina]|uniref:uncharacterized protein n=1 Tax=Kickxella alabastrina TaxID=61397 RepID=UPI0022211C0F|nr:uncharacterized protein BX661DRAFT_170069 [Kickxella alabastrina]KAI7830871.1 hypothetical protein BX661DRAFT_170069 [Kickxella alabastrina]